MKSMRTNSWPCRHPASPNRNQPRPRRSKARLLNCNDSLLEGNAVAPQGRHVRHDQPVVQPHAQARLHDHSLLRLYVQWSAPSNENEVEWAKRATSLPRCSSTWDDSRNQPREGEFVHHCVACQRRMLIRSRSLSGHRTTLTSSVVRNPILVRCLVAAMSLR